jgi:hypothetical protein
LVSNISPTSSGRIESDRLYEDYKQACTHAKVDYFSKSVFSRFVFYIFPYSKNSIIKSGSERTHVYVGIDKATPTQSSSLYLTEIQNHLDAESILLSKSLLYAKIGVIVKHYCKWEPCGQGNNPAFYPQNMEFKSARCNYKFEHIRTVARV